MKKYYSLYLACAVMAATILTGCGNKTLGSDLPPPTIVETVEAEAGFDLSSRGDWKLTVGGYSYDTTISGNKVSGTATEQPFYFMYNETSATVRLQHPAITTQARDVLQKGKDQSTTDKLLMHDILAGVSTDGVTSDIKGVKLKHQSPLLEFTVNGLPDNAEVYLLEKDAVIVTPCRDEENPNLYRAIVEPTSSYRLALCIKNASGVFNKVINIGEAQPVESRMAAGLPRPHLAGLIFTFDTHIEQEVVDETEVLIISIDNMKVNTSGNWSIDKL